MTYRFSMNGAEGFHKVDAILDALGEAAESAPLTVVEDQKAAGQIDGFHVESFPGGSGEAGEPFHVARQRGPDREDIGCRPHLVGIGAQMQQLADRHVLDWHVVVAIGMWVGVDAPLLGKRAAAAGDHPAWGDRELVLADALAELAGALELRPLLWAQERAQ